jgi:hypothetical protein
MKQKSGKAQKAMEIILDVASRGCNYGRAEGSDNKWSATSFAAAFPQSRFSTLHSITNHRAAGEHFSIIPAFPGIQFCCNSVLQIIWQYFYSSSY